jgi:hypothetical protein
VGVGGFPIVVAPVLSKRIELQVPLPTTIGVAEAHVLLAGCAKVLSPKSRQ